MANFFKNFTGQGTTTGATIYTVPAATQGIILGLNLANILGSSITVSVQLGSTYIIKDAPLPSSTALSVLDGKIVAKSGDTIVVTASANSAVDVIISVMETTN